MDNINKRILFLIEELGYNRVSFAKVLERDNPLEIQNIVGAKKTKPSPDMLSVLMKKFPEINADWLLTGRGKPFKIDLQKENVLTFRDKFENELIDQYLWDSGKDEIIAEQKQEIEVLKTKFESIKNQLMDKETIITTMKRLIDEIDDKKEKGMVG